MEVHVELLERFRGGISRIRAWFLAVCDVLGVLRRVNTTGFGSSCVAGVLSRIRLST